MLSFAAEFPVDHDRTADDFLLAVRTWIGGSPHTKLGATDLAGLGVPGEVRLQKGNESVETLRVSSDGEDVVGIKHARRDSGLLWTMTAVLSRKALDSWVGLRVWCESDHPAVRVPPAKKPVLVRTLLETLGGAVDGTLRVGHAPLRLTNTDVDLATRLISGKSGCRLPIVYVSAGPQERHAVDAAKLAASLAGMAHVAVEPNRAFSLRLKIDVNSENVYGGAVGIYWPDGAGRRSYFVARQFESPAEMAATIADEIREALTNRLGLERCSWPFVQEAASRQVIQQLRASGSQEVQKYIETFDKELAAKDERLDASDKEIKRLITEIQIRDARLSARPGSLLQIGSERDYYPNEVLGIVRAALSDSVSRVPSDSRRQHVLSAILQANALDDDDSASLRERVKTLLRGSRGIDAKIRSGLEEMGFAITGDGKHYKLTYHGDDRYVFTLPKTGSDHRGGLNAASDIGRLLF